MGAPQQWSRDKAWSDEDALFLRADFTKDVLSFLESVAAMKVYPFGIATVIATLNGFGINFNIPALAALLANSLPGGFKCVSAPLDDGTPRIRVFYGNVNSFRGDDGMAPGDAPPFYLSPVGSGVVVLKVTVDEDGYLPYGSGREVLTAAAVPDDTDDEFHLTLGTFGTDADGVFRVTPGGQGNGVGDQSFELCGGPGGVPNWGPA